MSPFGFFGVHPEAAAKLHKPLFSLPGLDPQSPFTKPLFLGLAALSLLGFFLARNRRPAQLAFLLAAIAAAVQLWKTQATGTYVEWYYPLLLIGIFADRPTAGPPALSARRRPFRPAEQWTWSSASPLAQIFALLAFVAYLAPGLLLLLLLRRPPERASTWLALVGSARGRDPDRARVRAQALLDAAAGTVRCHHRARDRAPRRRPRHPPPVPGEGLARRARPHLRGGRPDGLRHGVSRGDLEAAAHVRRDRSGRDGAGARDALPPAMARESGLKGFGQGLIAFAFPSAWFGVWHGPRLAFLMFLGVVAAGVLALVEARRQERLGWIAAAAIARFRARGRGHARAPGELRALFRGSRRTRPARK